jgi:hypothetical protein
MRGITRFPELTQDAPQKSSGEVGAERFEKILLWTEKRRQGNAKAPETLLEQRLFLLDFGLHWAK